MNIKIITEKKVKNTAFFSLSLFFIILSRLYYLQLYRYDEFIVRAQKNFFRIEKTTAHRGSIFDCKGNILATNKEINTIYWQGTGNRILNEKQLDSLKLLEKIIEKPIIGTPIYQRILTAERKSSEALINPNATFEELSKVKELFTQEQNICIHTHLKRYYPNSTVASHIVGHLNSISTDCSGKMGLEKIFEEHLRSKNGTKIKKVNSLGASLQEQEIDKALSGEDIVTTLDLSIQQLAEKSFPDYYTGCIIIMDSISGALHALVSRPSFDPTLFLNPISFEKWHLLQQQGSFLNRALNACYPPASIFKLITLSAALENNIIQPDETFLCKGFIQFKGRKYYCNKRNGHGNLSIMEAIAQSCNIPFFKIAKKQKISIDLIAQYARRFGLGSKTNILLPEQEGLVPSSSWKQEVFNERWWTGETVSASIGQSYLQATPLQMLRAFNSIFSGSLVKPRIVQTEQQLQEPLLIQPQTRSFLKKSTRLAVTQGRLKEIGTIPGLKVYAKTGTAQVSSLSRKKKDNHYKEHAWVVVHVKPCKGKDFSLIILVEHAGSSKEAITIAKKLLTGYTETMLV